MLAALGLRRGDRVLMVVKDCPLFFYLFWGAIKAGFVPVPLNTLLRAPDYRFVIENARAACVVWSPEFAGEIAGALAEASYRPAHALPADGEGDTFLARLGAASDALAPAPARCRRSRLLGSTRPGPPARPRAPFTAIATWW